MIVSGYKALAAAIQIYCAIFSTHMSDIALAANADILTERMNQVAFGDGTVVLGMDAALDDVQWYRGAKGLSYLALKDEVDRALHVAEQPVPVILIAFGKFKTDNFFLTSTGGYVGPTAITPTLADVKGNAVLAAPGLGEGIDDGFRLAVQQLDLIRDNAAPDAKKTKRGAVDGAGNERGVKLRHVYFEPIAEDEQSALRESEDDPNESLSDAFKMRNWYCSPAVVRAEMDELVQKLTHRAVPLAAYDIAGNIIPPSEYQQKLAGAIVEARFTLSHVKVKGVHYFSADVAQLDVLVAAPVFKRVHFPLKRSVSEFSMVSPKKKARKN